MVSCSNNVTRPLLPSLNKAKNKRLTDKQEECPTSSLQIEFNSPSGKRHTLFIRMSHIK